MMKNKMLTAALLAALAAMPLQAKVVLPSVIGDHMVLQQNSQAALWGRADAGSRVTIRPSWSGQTVAVEADAEGRWQARVATPAAGGPYEIEISDGEALVLRDVLVGEVWFCSGQSNMEMPVEGFGCQPVEGAADVILGARAGRPIRMCTVQKKISASPLEECTAQWETNTPESVARASATAYFFADCLQEVLGVPVGLLIADWGGTPIEAWMDRETMAAFPEFDLAFLEKEGADRSPYAPTVLYNGMVSPVVPYTLRGFLWYQGEANRGRAAQYRRLQPEYVKMMRRKWGNEAMPFYYVQIAPFNYGGPEDLQGALLREAQMKNLEDIPRSGMAVTLDIGDYDCIHPAKKKEVGRRLAYLALTQEYGMKGISAEAPLYESMAVKEGKVELIFRVGHLGLAPLGHALTGFEVAGEDRKFHPAQAFITAWNRVTVSCPEVPQPAAVRYCFKDRVEPSLYNCFGIPASSFRTDDWE